MAESKRDPQATARRTLDRDHASSLRQLAAGLPSVDHALDELISRANQTELDVGIWNTPADADHATQGEGWRDAEALDAEALDAEALDAEALDAEALNAEALNAEALNAEPPAPEALNAEALDVEALDVEALDVELLEAERRDAEAREHALRHQLDHLQARLADAEARTATAEPRAAPPRPWPWLAVGSAFLGGLALMFAVARLTAPAKPPADAMQAREAATPAATPKLTVTPIQAPTVTPIDPIDPPAATEPAATEPAATEPAATEPAAAAPPAAASHDVAKPRVRTPAPPDAPAHAASPRGEIADPFAEPAKPGDRPAPRDRRPPGPIVDPF